MERIKTITGTLILLVLLLPANEIQSLDSSKTITAFAFSDPAVDGNIDENQKNIDVTLPYGTNLTSLVATFTTTGVSVKVGNTEQESGITANDFTNSVTYSVTAEDGTTQDYQISVTDDPYQYTLGERGPANGWIFYINSNAAADGWKYLECSPEDQTPRVWGTKGFSVPGADGTAIGTGKQNTLDIVNNDTGTADKAADECAGYTVTNNGIVYGDWFLPSKDTLCELYTNLISEEKGNFTHELGYWSSSQDGADAAWLQYVNSDSQIGYAKKPTIDPTTIGVRAVRAF